MKKNITIVCLNKDFGEKVAQKIAEMNKMTYLNLDDYVDLKMLKSKPILLEGAETFLSNAEEECLKHVKKHENFVYFVSCDIFLANNNEKMFKNTQIVFLETDYEKISSKLNKNKLRATELNQNKVVGGLINEFVLKNVNFIIKNSDEKSIEEILKEINSKLQ